MFKNILILILSLISMVSNAQTLKLTFSQTRNIDSEKLAKIPDPAMKKMIMDKLSKPTYFELVSCNGYSLYQKKDSENSSVFKNHIDKKMTSQKDIMGDIFLIEEDMEGMNWVIHEETKNIGNFKCKKATLGDNITAWFTEEIPIGDGPDTYYIPSGLILRVETKNTKIEIEDMELLEKNKILSAPTKGKKITKEKFEDARKKMLDSMKGGNVIRF